MSADRKRDVVRGYLEDADADLEMAELGAHAGNRLAAFHAQQAAEKLVKAVRAYYELRLTSSHDIDELVNGNEYERIEPIPVEDKWRARLLPFAKLTQYATAFRYPSPTGRRKAAPMDAVGEDISALRALRFEMAEQLLSEDRPK